MFTLITNSNMSGIFWSIKLDHLKVHQVLKIDRHFCFAMGFYARVYGNILLCIMITPNRSIFIKKAISLRAAVMYTIGYNGVQICKKNIFLKHGVQNSHRFTQECVQCKVYSVHFVCTHYGRKMLSALKITTNQKIPD